MQISLYYCINQGRIYVLVLTFSDNCTTTCAENYDYCICIYLVIYFFIVLLKCNKKL